MIIAERIIRKTPHGSAKAMQRETQRSMNGGPFVEWDFWIGWTRPNIQPGDRVYIVCEGKLRGYAPLIRLHYEQESGRYALIRGGARTAVAVTLRNPSGTPIFIQGFRGFRYVWWNRDDESPFPEWRTP